MIYAVLLSSFIRSVPILQLEIRRQLFKFTQL